LSGVTETLWDAGGTLHALTPTLSLPQSKPEVHSPLAIHTAAFVRVLVLLAAGLALCFGESNHLTWRVAKVKSSSYSAFAKKVSWRTAHGH
jgi:hypothetical protein